MRKTKKIIIVVASALGIVLIGVRVASKVQKKANKSEQKNMFEGKRVIFVEDENDSENADGVRGHLVSVGKSEHKLTFYDKCIKRGRITMNNSF